MTDIVTVREFYNLLRTLPPEKQRAAIEARDAAIRTDQARQCFEQIDNWMLKYCGSITIIRFRHDFGIEHRAGIGMEKGDG